MKILIVLFIIFFSPVIVFAEISSFVFVSTNALESQGRQTISVQSQNSAGEKENITQTACLEIKTTSVSGKFFGSSTGVDPVSTLVLTMSKNSANRNFYYEDSVSGSYVFNLKVAYRPEGESCNSEWSNNSWSPSWIANQSYGVGGGTLPSSDSSGTGSSEDNQSPPVVTQSNTSTLPIEQKVFAEIKLDSKTVITGAQFFVSGEGYGLEKKPITNARFLWNFGDGTVKLGQSIAHTYRNPGEYMIVLDVSSEKFAGTARQLVTVIKSPLTIDLTKDNLNTLIKITNNSSVELDLSGWFIESEGNKFLIPLHTILLPKKFLIFDQGAISFNVGDQVSLLYPTGAVAHMNSVAQKIVNHTQVQPQTNIVLQKKTDVVQPKKNILIEENINLDQVAGPVMAFDDSKKDIFSEKENQEKNIFWIISFIVLLVISAVSVFFIKRPVYNQADEFTIEE